MKKPDINPPAPSEATTTPTTGVVSSINGAPIAVPGQQMRPSQKVAAFVKDHPMVLVAGGIAVGAMATALMPRKTRRKLADRAFSAARTASLAAFASARRGSETAEAELSTLGARTSKGARLLLGKSEELTEAAIDQAEDLSHRAASRAGKFGKTVLSSAASLSKKTSRQAKELGSDVSEMGTELSDETISRLRRLRKRLAR